METLNGLPILSFPDAAAWRTWLERHHGESTGLWLRIFKKSSGSATVTYAEALDEALCFGWIDSTKNRYDEQSFLQRFSPRKGRSPWSKVNREHVERLIIEGKMRPPGRLAIEEAQRNGAWEAAYDSQSRMAVPDDFQVRLDAHPDALAFFKELTSANRYALLYRIQTAKKPETRAKRIEWALELLLRKETVH